MLELKDLTTPCLLLDESRMMRNIERLKGRLHRLGVPLNPHLKTAKCIEIARRLMDADGQCTVSTLAEAEYLAAAGVRRMIYAVGIAPGKLARVTELRATGVDLAVLLDSVEQARAVCDAGCEAGQKIPAFIEIDSDGHRSGVAPNDRTLLLQIGRTLHEGGAELRGILTHAGESYHAPSDAALQAIAEQERAAAVAAANILIEAGLPCPVVSVGSTPTAHFARDLTGVSEVRAGVFVFVDLVMAGIGVCTLDDIALSVLATVIGHQREHGWILIDAGWMALSRDRGTAGQKLDQGYGVVCDIHGRPFDDLIVADTNQEHGIVALRRSSGAQLPDLPIGSMVRVLPNHACATAGQHDRYHVLDKQSLGIAATWSRLRGW